MPFPFRVLLAFLVVPLISIPAANADETTDVSVSLTGNSIINLDEFDTLLRAYVDVFNFDPSDGIYSMHIIQTSTGNTVSEQTIMVRDRGNDQAGVNVAYLVNEDVMGPGDYEILISSEFGTAVGKTNFSVIKPSESSYYPAPEDVPTISQSKSTDENESASVVQLKENVTLDPQSQTEKEQNVIIETDSQTNAAVKIPEWVRNIFIMYSSGTISEDELLNALKFLISQEIIIV